MVWRIFRIFAPNMTKNNIYLASKPRYEILDGLRGVAAVLVVAYRLYDLPVREWLKNKLFKTNLAVK